MKKFFLILLFSALGTVIFAQEKHLVNVSETEVLSSKVVELYKQKKYTKAISELAPYWPLSEEELSELTEQTVKSMAIVTDRYGKVVGSEKIKSETISDFAVRETYIVRYEFHALRLIFTYYKNDSGWVVNAFKWDDKFMDEFEETK